MISPEVLRRYPYFASIGEDSLKAIAMMAVEKSIAAGSQLFCEGDPAESLSVIVTGQVEIHYILGNGERRTVDTLVEGDLLMWSALVEPYKATAVGIASKPTRLVSIEAKRLRGLCDKDPMVGYRLMTQVAKLLAHRLEGARVQLAAAD
jgi:CRP/FNR family transcriptional regulator, cyclic AMP receptor protein